MPRFAQPFSQPSVHPSPMFGEDLLGFVGFHGAAFVIAKPASAHAPWLTQRSQILHDRIGGGGTNITAGLRQSLALLRFTPPGVQRRIWLLSDGEANVETGAPLWAVVEEARRAYVNINTIGFGDKFDEATLHKISSATHSGKFVSVRTLRELTNAFGVVFHSANGHNDHRRYHRHRAETTILAIDLSASMQESMEGRPKVSVVEEAVLELIKFKQRVFS